MRENLPTMLRTAAKEWRKENKVVATGATRYDAALDEAADAIEELQGKADAYLDAMTYEHNRAARLLWDKEHCWIPVTERLPSAEKEVYVTDGEYIARAVLLDEVFPGDKPCWSYSGLGEITHWCEKIPLPQPPKEER